MLVGSGTGTGRAGTRVARHRPYQALKTTVSIGEGLIFNEILRVEGAETSAKRCACVPAVEGLPSYEGIRLI